MPKNSKTHKKISKKRKSSKIKDNSLKKQIDTLFNEFDVFRDGKISVEEFRNMLDSRLPRKEVDIMFKKIDTGGEGYLTRKEFGAAFSMIKKVFHNFKSKNAPSKHTSPKPETDIPRTFPGEGGARSFRARPAKRFRPLKMPNNSKNFVKCLGCNPWNGECKRCRTRGRRDKVRARTRRFK